MFSVEFSGPRRLIESSASKTQIYFSVTKHIFLIDTHRVGFYNNDCLYPATASDVDGMVSGLKDLINVIPGAAISAEK
jgi:hypothetical protein